MSTDTITAATSTVFARCNGDHTRECSWHAVSAVAENATESGLTEDVDSLTESALDVIDSACHC